MEQGGFDKIRLCRRLRCINLLLSASEMQICGEFSEGTKSPEVDQSCLFHRRNSVSHEAQSGIVDLMRPGRPCCVCDRCSPHEKFTISVILFSLPVVVRASAWGLIEQQMYYQLKIAHT